MTEELLSSTGEKAVVRASDESISVTLANFESTLSVDWNGEAEGIVTSDQRERRFFAIRRGDEVELWLEGAIYRIKKAGSAPRTVDRPGSDSGEITASMPGMVVRVLVSDGDTVAEGDGILVLESMKMQLTLSAPRAGIVRDLITVQGSMVEQGAVLARIEPEVAI